mgnify:FL=1
MQLAALKTRRTAILHKGAEIVRSGDLCQVQFVDFDQFLENFDLWSKDSEPTVKLFFESSLIVGAKQCLARTDIQLVGVYGDKLNNNQYLNEIIIEYHQRGYDVIITDSNQLFNYKPCNSNNKVQIQLK